MCAHYLASWILLNPCPVSINQATKVRIFRLDVL